MVEFRSTTVTNGAATNIKLSSGKVFGWNIDNGHTADIFVKLYNVANATSASTPIRTLRVPASGSVFHPPIGGFGFSTALSVRVVTGRADNNDTAPATLPIIELTYE